MDCPSSIPDSGGVEAHCNSPVGVSRVFAETDKTWYNIQHRELRETSREKIDEDFRSRDENSACSLPGLLCVS